MPQTSPMAWWLISILFMFNMNILIMSLPLKSKTPFIKKSKLSLMKWMW